MGKLIKIYNSYDKKISGLRTKQLKMQEKYQLMIDKLKAKQFKVSQRLSHLKKLRQMKCKHDFNNPVKRLNPRDDASFKYWCSCSKCGCDIGHVNFDGTFEKQVWIYG